MGGSEANAVVEEKDTHSNDIKGRVKCASTHLVFTSLVELRTYKGVDFCSDETYPFTYAHKGGIKWSNVFFLNKT